MSRAFPIMMLVAGAAMAWFGLAITGPAIADMCDGQQTLCNDSCIWEACASSGPETHAACVSQCLSDCESAYGQCRVGHPKAGANSNFEPPMYPTNPPPWIIGPPPNQVGVEQPPADAPPPKLGFQPPGNVGVNKQPVGGTGTSGPTGPTGVHPVFPVNPINPINQPGTGTTQTGGTAGSGETIYAKSGSGKTVTTTSPIGLTTTTVYDPKGNYTSTITDPTGKILEKTTTILDPNGGSKSTTADATGHILNTATKTLDKNGGYISVMRDKFGNESNRTLYNSAGQIVSQGKNITTHGTSGIYSSGKGNKEVFMGELSQKHNVKEHIWGATSGASSFPTPSHAHGGHK